MSLLVCPRVRDYPSHSETLVQTATAPVVVCGGIFPPKSRGRRSLCRGVLVAAAVVDEHPALFAGIFSHSSRPGRRYVRGMLVVGLYRTHRKDVDLSVGVAQSLALAMENAIRFRRSPQACCLTTRW